MVGVAEMFAELSEPDFYDVSAQLELFCWHARRRQRQAQARYQAKRRDALREYQRNRLRAMTPEHKQRARSGENSATPERQAHRAYMQQWRARRAA